MSFHYPGSDRPVFDGLDLTIPAGTSLAIVGQNGAGKTTLAKLLCRLYDPDSGAIEVDGCDLRSLDLADWRSRITAVFQDFVRFELSLRQNVDPAGRAAEEDVRAALQDAGLDRMTDLDIPLAKGYPGGTDLRADSGSGSRWPARSAPSGVAPVWCCSTSRRPSWTYEVRPRSSTGCWRRPGSRP